MDKAWNSAFCGLHPLAAAEILIHAGPLLWWSCLRAHSSEVFLP